MKLRITKRLLTGELTRFVTQQHVCGVWVSNAENLDTLRFRLEPRCHYNQLMMDLVALTSIAIACHVVKPAQALSDTAQSLL